MRLPGRLSAAIEILNDIQTRHKPAAGALSDWARAHRFAGSGDRAVIGNLVYDVLRAKASLSARMADDAPRALVLALLHDEWALPCDQIAQLVEQQFGPGALSQDERTNLSHAVSAARPAHIAGNYPEWLAPEFERVFGNAAARQGNGLAQRAPVDLRVNQLKSTPAKVLSALKKFGAVAGPLVPGCIKIPTPGRDQRSANVEAEPAHARGWFEVQDEASQAAALLCDAAPGMQVADVCAGAGGKTLALASVMENRGQIHAHDTDRHRLKAIFPRLARAGCRNVQVIAADEADRLGALAGRMDRVVVDAPCSGSGAWRRRPDSKWRLTPQLLAKRIDDQRQILTGSAGLVKPGGRLIYITCSLLGQENADQVDAFLSRHGEFSVLAFAGVWQKVAGTQPPVSADGSDDALLLTPATHGTDGFFVCIMQRAG